MSSIHLFLNHSIYRAAGCLRRRLPAPFNGGRTVACASLDVRAAPESLSAVSSGGKLGSKEVVEAEAKVLVGTYVRTPVVLVSGKGCKLYDLEGWEYLDITSGIAVNTLGHGDPDWIRTVTEQANLLTHVSNVF